MCFYYSINKQNTQSADGKGVVDKNLLHALPNKFVVNGFENPQMPVISNQNPSKVDFYYWGLVPNTINSIDTANRFRKMYNTLNAKIENVFSSKIYSHPIMSNRCLVLASGFFEWQSTKSGKVGYYITLANKELFAFAGIWDSWVDEMGSTHKTYSLLTTQANELMAEIHNTKKRMPVILPPDIAKHWLETSLSKEDIISFSQPIKSDCLVAYTVRNFLKGKKDFANTPRIIEPFTINSQPNPSSKGNYMDKNQLSIDF